MRQAPVCFVVCADKSAQPAFWVEDCSGGLENLMIEGASHGIGTCWIAVRTAQSHGQEAEAYVRGIMGLRSTPGPGARSCRLPGGYAIIQRQNPSANRGALGPILRTEGMRTED